MNSTDPIRLGAALQYARKRRGMTQEQGAEVIGVARTTLTAIECGKRLIRSDELIKLAEAYGVSVNSLVGHHEDQGENDAIILQFRSLASIRTEDRHEADKVVDSLRNVCLKYLELEELLGAPLPQNYPQEYVATGLDVDVTARLFADRERTRLKLGDGPIRNLRSTLEQEVGVRIFNLTLPTRISEIYFYTEKFGACMAVNRRHPFHRRQFSLAHGYLHFLAHRYRPEVQYEDQYRRKPAAEMLADAFARDFLMPESGITRQFTEIQRSDNGFTVADLIRVADYYSVSVEAMCRRLEELKLLRSGMWESLKDRGLKVRKEQENLGLRKHQEGEENNERWPSHYSLLALVALDEGKITESAFAEYLDVDRLEARECAENIRRRRSDAIDFADPHLWGENLLNYPRSA